MLYVVGPDGKLPRYKVQGNKAGALRYEGEKVMFQRELGYYFLDLEEVGKNIIRTVTHYNNKVKGEEPKVESARVCFVSGLRYKHPLLSERKHISLPLILGLEQELRKQQHKGIDSGIKEMFYAYDDDVFGDSFRYIDTVCAGGKD